MNIFRDTNHALGKPACQISQFLNQWVLLQVALAIAQYTYAVLNT